MPVDKIISGGQTGVDRAALDFALKNNIPCGGWCPKGRRAEDGPIPSRYPLQETDSKNYAERTRRNVRDSDGTLIITRGKPTGGTALTIEFSEALHRPVKVIDLDAETGVEDIRQWIESDSIGVLNIAGPRASQDQHIHDDALRTLGELFSAGS